MNQIKRSDLKLLNRITQFVGFVSLFFVLNDSTAQEVYDLSRSIKTGLERNFSLQVVRNQEEIATNNYTR